LQHPLWRDISKESIMKRNSVRTLLAIALLAMLGGCASVPGDSFVYAGNDAGIVDRMEGA